MVKRRPKTSVIWLFGMRLRWDCCTLLYLLWGFLLTALFAHKLASWFIGPYPISKVISPTALSTLHSLLCPPMSFISPMSNLPYIHPIPLVCLYPWPSPLEDFEFHLAQARIPVLGGLEGTLSGRGMLELWLCLVFPLINKHYSAASSEFASHFLFPGPSKYDFKCSFCVHLVRKQ